MAKCKLNGIDFIHSVFSPSIAVTTSPDADLLCDKNNLTFVELLKPFSKLSQDIYVKDTSNINHVVRGLQIIFQDSHMSQCQPAYIKKLLSDVVLNCHPDVVSPLVSTGSYDVHIPVSTPWFEAYRDVFLTTLPAHDHELLHHCLGVVFVVSTSHPTPVDQFAKMTQAQNYHQNQQANKPPRWFCPNVLKFYLLLHDVTDGDQAKADSIYTNLKSIYGATSCHMLPINSRAPPPPTSSQGGAPGLLDPWMQYLVPVGASLTGPGDGSQETTLGPQGESTNAPGPSGYTASEESNLAHPLAGSPSIPDAMGTDPDFPMQFNAGSGMRASSSLPHISFLNGAAPTGNSGGVPGQTGGSRLPYSSPTLYLPHGQCITPVDQDRIRAFVYELVVKALVPWVEKTMKTLNEQIASKMRLSRSLFSGARKFFGGGGGSNMGAKSSSTASLTASQSGSSSDLESSMSGGSGGASMGGGGRSGGGTTQVVYTQEAPELQMRRYADLAFLFHQYEVAHQAYMVLKKDFQNEAAWIHFAGVMEMSALSVFIQGSASQRQYPHHYMEQAISHYLNQCRNYSLATRAALLNAEALKSRGMYSEASVYFLKLTTEDNDLRSALLLEQAAHCYVNMRVPMVRKFAFHMVLAGHRFIKAGQKKHAVRCYTKALQIYKGRGCTLAEDHINFTIGRQSYYLRQLDVAAGALQHLLSKTCRQTAEQQSIFLREFIFVFKQHLISMIGENKTLLDGVFPQLPLPIVTRNQVKVMLGRPIKQIEDALEESDSHDISVDARGVQFSDTDLYGGSWSDLEEICVTAANEGTLPVTHRQTITCFTRDTPNKFQPKTPVGEAVTVQIPLENPIQVPLVLTDLYLLWQFVPQQGSGEGGPRTITNEMERDRLQQAKEVVTTELMQDFYLLPGERKPVELSVVPKQQGQLHVIGLAFNLGTSSPNQQLPAHIQSASMLPDLSGQGSGGTGSGGGLVGDAQLVAVKGKATLEVQGRKDTTKQQMNTYLPDYRLNLLITPAMPLLKVVFSELPSSLMCGEVRRITLHITNQGSQPLTQLRLASSHPGFLIFGFDEFAHTLDSHVYQTLQPKQNQSPTPEEYMCPDLPCVPCSRVPLASPAVLPPGGSTTLACWIRGQDVPTQIGLPIDILFYYQSTETNTQINHRVLRHRSIIELVPSLKLRAKSTRSRGSTTSHLLISLEAENATPVKDQVSTEFAILQVSGASKNWVLRHLTTNKTSESAADYGNIRINPGEVICICLRAEPSRSQDSPRTSSAGHTTFSNLVFDQQKREIHSAGTPCADFFYRYVGESNQNAANTARSANKNQGGSPVDNASDIDKEQQTANRVGVSLIILWKMIQIRSDASVVKAVGQSHITIPFIDEWITEPVESRPLLVQRLTPSPEPEQLLPALPLIVQPKTVRLQLKHVHLLKHDFHQRRLARVPVDIHLYNAGDIDLAVRVEAIESEIKGQSQSSGFGEPHFTWVGLTHHHLRLPAHASLSFPLTACLPRPGVYQLHTLTVKAAIAPSDANLSHADLIFVKQNNSFSSLLVVDQAIDIES